MIKFKEPITNHTMVAGFNKRNKECLPNGAQINNPCTVITYATQIPYQYKFGAKEWQDELGLGWYDYQARNYDPALGRWNVIDPMAPKYFSHSPYAYTLNNPVYFIDPTGMMVEMGDQLENGGPTVVDNGDPTVYMGELDGLVLTAKAPQRSSSSSSGSGFSLSMSGFGFRSSFSSSNTPNFWDGAYRNMLSDENREGYLKMQQAKREGEWFAVGALGGSIVAIYAAPAVITYSSIYAETQVGSYIMQSTGKFALDITAKGLFSGVR